MNAIAGIRRLTLDVRLAAGSKRSPGDSPLDREAERNRRAALSGITAALARIVQMGSSLITVPFAIRYLGNERFGLWMAISSFLAIAGFADFGLGNGLLNSIARAQGKDDTEGVKRALSSAFASLCLFPR